MATNNIFQKVRDSRLGKAIASLDRDKQRPGFQLTQGMISPQPSTLPQQKPNVAMQYLKAGANELGNVFNNANQSAAKVAKYNPVQTLGNITGNPILSSFGSAIDTGIRNFTNYKPEAPNVTDAYNIVKAASIPLAGAGTLVGGGVIGLGINAATNKLQGRSAMDNAPEAFAKGASSGAFYKTLSVANPISALQAPLRNKELLTRIAGQAALNIPREGLEGFVEGAIRPLNEGESRGKAIRDETLYGAAFGGLLAPVEEVGKTVTNIMKHGVPSAITNTKGKLIDAKKGQYLKITQEVKPQVEAMEKSVKGMYPSEAFKDIPVKDFEQIGPRKFRVKPKNEEVMGALAGFEYETDEDGKITGVKFNPEKAVLGMGAVLMGKNLKIKSSKVFDLLNQSETPEEAVKRLELLRSKATNQDSFQILKKGVGEFKKLLVTGPGKPRDPINDGILSIIEDIETTNIKNFPAKMASVDTLTQKVKAQKTRQKEIVKSGQKLVDELNAQQLQTSRQLPKNKTKSIIKLSAQQKRETLDDIITSARKEVGRIEDKPGRSIKESLENAYTQWVDRFNPVVKASRTAKNKLRTQGASLRPEYDPEYLVRRFTGAGGIANTKFETELKPIVDQMESIGVPKADMDAYLKARRDIGLSDRNILGSDSNLATKRIIAFEAKYQGIKDIAEQLYTYQNKGFQEMIDSGFISKDMGDLIKQQNPDYVPFQRVMDDLDNYLGIPSQKLQQGTQPIKKIKGSERQIYSPIESVIANTFKQRGAIEKNNVAKSIVGLAQIDPEIGFSKVAKSGDDTITIWNNGNKEYWQVGKDIADVVKGVNEENANALLKIFQAPASLLRQGATGRNPDFLIPNVVKDQLDAAITSKYGYIPFVDYFSGLKSILKNDDVYQKWASSGAKIDLGELSGRKSIQQSFDVATKKKGLFQWLGAGLDTLGKYSEQPTRVGLFKKAYKKTGNQLLAAMESRDATVDFARMGSKMKVANSVVPFLNVGIQGFDKLIRAAKDNPGKLALLGGLYGTLPTIATTLYNLQNHPEEYGEIPQYVKDSNFVFVIGRNKEGTVDYRTIPKGNVLPLISNPTENFLSYLYDQNDQSFGEFATQFISSALPVIGDGSTAKEVAVKTIGQNLPQLIKPATENLMNKSFFKFDPNKQESKEIVPYYLKDKEPYKQAYEWTPETYKAIGAVLNVSPLQVQNLAEGYLAGFTKVPTQIIGILNKVSRGESVRKNDIPIARRFISTTFPSSRQKPEREKPTTPLMERITGKVSASNKVVTSQVIDDIKEAVKYGDEVTDQELYTAYLNKPLTMKAGNRYEKSMRNSELWSAATTIRGNENLSDAQKTVLYDKVSQELGVSRQDLDLYEVARQDNNTKTLYALDQIDQFKSPEELLGFLVNGRKPVNGKILAADGVIDNLVDDGIIPYDLGKELKAIDFNVDGTLKTGKPKSGSGKKSSRSKANDTYLSNLSKIFDNKPKKIATSQSRKIDVSKLTMS